MAELTGRECVKLWAGYCICYTVRLAFDVMKERYELRCLVCVSFFVSSTSQN